jgi:hypothetical protein
MPGQAGKLNMHRVSKIKMLKNIKPNQKNHKAAVRRSDGIRSAALNGYVW